MSFTTAYRASASPTSRIIWSCPVWNTELNVDRLRSLLVQVRAGAKGLVAAALVFLRGGNSAWKLTTLSLRRDNPAVPRLSSGPCQASACRPEGEAGSRSGQTSPSTRSLARSLLAPADIGLLLAAEKAAIQDVIPTLAVCIPSVIRERSLHAIAQAGATPGHDASPVRSGPGGCPPRWRGRAAADLCLSDSERISTPCFSSDNTFSSVHVGCSRV